MTKLILPFFLGLSCLAQADDALVARDDVKSYITETARNYKFSETELTNLFSQVQSKPNILDILDRPATGRPWYEFRGNFVNRQRIQSGARFWQQNAATLEKVATTYKVDPAVIVAILGAETMYGRNTGSFRVLDVLSTLSFDYPRRAEFFRKEMTEFLLLAREEKTDPLSFRGSYAGAMGWPQFMPSSFRQYAVDWDRDGHHDIWSDQEDIIASVGHYLAEHGWQESSYNYIAADVSSDTIDDLLADKFNLHYTVSELMRKGVTPSAKIDPNEKAVVYVLETAPGQKKYYLGLNNFYVVTRYNKSTLYATAVLELAEEIRGAWQRGEGLPAEKAPAKAAPAPKKVKKLL